jgi:hypothetical protein
MTRAKIPPDLVALLEGSPDFRDAVSRLADAAGRHEAAAVACAVYVEEAVQLEARVMRDHMPRERDREWKVSKVDLAAPTGGRTALVTQRLSDDWLAVYSVHLADDGRASVQAIQVRQNGLWLSAGGCSDSSLPTRALRRLVPTRAVAEARQTIEESAGAPLGMRVLGFATSDQATPPAGGPKRRRRRPRTKEYLEEVARLCMRLQAEPEGRYKLNERLGKVLMISTSSARDLVKACRSDDFKILAPTTKGASGVYPGENYVPDPNEGASHD